MATFFFVLIAIGLGLMLFSTLQEDLPKELAFLKSAPVVQSPNTKMQLYQGWKVTSVDNTVEMVKEFSAPFVVNGSSKAVPIMGILCNEEQLDIRVDTRSATTGTRTSEVLVDGKAERWEKGADNNLFPPDARQLLTRLVAADTPVPFTLSFLNEGAQTAQLNAVGLKEMVAQLPLSCQGY